MSDVPDPSPILEFWFGPLDVRGMPTDPEQKKRWFKKDPDADRTIRERFLPLHGQLTAGACESWRDRPRSRLAGVILLDQLSRNMFRDTPEAFASDHLARSWASEGIERGHPEALGVMERCFFCMPFVHSEDLSDQERGIGEFEKLLNALSEEELRQPVADFLRFAEMHRDIVARFGRFPHRNLTLGRESTAEEIAFLKTPGSSF